MSQFSVPVVRIGAIEKHPNADTLSTTVVEGETVIIRTGDFQQGDAAIYVPVDAVVPTTVPGTEFLGEHRRIKAKRLRGIYSEGLLLPMTALGHPQSQGVDTGYDVAERLGIVKHEDKVPDTWGTGAAAGLSVPPKRGFWGNFFHWCFKEQLKTNEKDPGCAPVYDIENGKKYGPKVLVVGEEVVITEKLHGTNFRCGVVGDKFYVGSRNHFLRNLADRKSLWRERFGEFVRTKVLRRGTRGALKQNLYWKVALQYDLERKVREEGLDDYIFYGEVFGEVQDLKYGAKPGEVWLRLFDVYDTVEEQWADWWQVKYFAKLLGVDTVPVLYQGPFEQARVDECVGGSSTLAKHIREGCVVKPVATRVAPHFGRVIVKYVSEAYKLRKGGTELH